VDTCHDAAAPVDYFKLWPNLAFDIYRTRSTSCSSPGVATQTLIREIAYVHPDSRARWRAARYFNWRINRQVNLGQGSVIAGPGRHVFQQLQRRSAGESEVLPAQLRRRMRWLIAESRLRSAAAGWSPAPRLRLRAV